MLSFILMFNWVKWQVQNNRQRLFLIKSLVSQFEFRSLDFFSSLELIYSSLSGGVVTVVGNDVKIPNVALSVPSEAPSLLACLGVVHFIPLHARDIPHLNRGNSVTSTKVPQMMSSMSQELKCRISNCRLDIIPQAHFAGH